MIRCIKDLQPGDEVSACYGPHYLHNADVEERRKLLKDQYFFICKCKHCSVDPKDVKALSPEVTAKWAKLVDEVGFVFAL